MTESSTATTPPDGPIKPFTARLALAAGIGLLALILVLAGQSRPIVHEARLGNRVELVELIRAEQARVDALAARAEELSSRLGTLEAAHGDDADILGVLRAQLEELAPAAGQRPVRGPGLKVELADSPLRSSPSGDLNDLVIHEQDLQAVINALWSGGAEAMTVQGQRVLATTAIRCVGNTLLLHGAVYSPPYQIEAIGDPETLESALARDVAVERFRRSVKEFQVGFSVSAGELLELPGADGSVGLQVARPADTST